MAKWVAQIYDTLKDAETAIEAIDNDIDFKIFAFKEGAFQKTLVAQGASIPQGREDINVETLATNKTLTAGVDEINQYLDGDGTNRIITLATAGATAGDRFVIRHNGVYTDSQYLHIKQGATELDIIYAGAIKEFIFDGTNWIPRSIGTGENNDKKNNLSIGLKAQGYNQGLAIGYDAQAHTYGVSVGRFTRGNTLGVAVGDTADGHDNGAAVGDGALGFSRGAAVGRNAFGYNYGVAFGYYPSSNDKKYAIAIGYRSKCNRVAETAINIDGLSSQKNQVIQGRWAKTTTNNTPVEIFCGGEANARFTLRANSALAFTILVVARDNVANHVAAYKIEGLIKRDGANNTVLSWSSKTVQHEDDAGWDITVSADDTNEALIITVTGDAANPTQWAARMDGVETVFVA